MSLIKIYEWWSQNSYLLFLSKTEVFKAEKVSRSDLQKQESLPTSNLFVFKFNHHQKILAPGHWFNSSSPFLHYVLSFAYINIVFHQVF